MAHMIVDFVRHLEVYWVCLLALNQHQPGGGLPETGSSAWTLKVFMYLRAYIHIHTLCMYIYIYSYVCMNIQQPLCC